MHAKLPLPITRFVGDVFLGFFLGFFCWFFVGFPEGKKKFLIEK